jgi:hypothetical protein
MTSPPVTRYPDYDVLNKRDSPSWDAPTRNVIDERLAAPGDPAFFNSAQWHAVIALCECIVPRRNAILSVRTALLIDAKLAGNHGDGYRDARLPPQQDAWRTALAAVDEECHARFGLPFASLEAVSRISLIEAMQRGELHCAAWNGIPSKLFFAERLLHDVCGAYYSLPHAWSEIGFGGPANPRGYVRMNFNRRDPWEASEAHPGREAQARKENRNAR